MLACVPCVPCVLINSCLPARRAAPTGVLDGAGEGFSIDWLVQPLNDWIKDGRRRKGKKKGFRGTVPTVRKKKKDTDIEKEERRTQAGKKRRKTERERASIREAEVLGHAREFDYTRPPCRACVGLDTRICGGVEVFVD